YAHSRSRPAGAGRWRPDVAFPPPTCPTAGVPGTWEGCDPQSAQTSPACLAPCLARPLARALAEDPSLDRSPRVTNGVHDRQHAVRRNVDLPLHRARVLLHEGRRRGSDLPVDPPEEVLPDDHRDRRRLVVAE